MKNLLASLLVAVALFASCKTPTASTAVRPSLTVKVDKDGVEAHKSALTCAAWNPNTTPWTCTDWDPNAVANFSSCGGDTNVYDGELVVFTGTNYTGHCYYTHPAASSCLQWNSWTDFEVAPIRSYKSRLYQNGVFYDQQNVSGTPSRVATFGEMTPTFPAWTPSSLRACN